MVLKTNKEYKCLSGLLSITVPAKVLAFVALFRMIKAERGCRPKSLHPILGKC